MTGRPMLWVIGVDDGAREAGSRHVPSSTAATDFVRDFLRIVDPLSCSVLGGTDTFVSKRLATSSEGLSLNWITMSSATGGRDAVNLRSCIHHHSILCFPTLSICRHGAGNVAQLPPRCAG